MVKGPYGLYNLKIIRKQQGLSMRQVYEAAGITCTQYARHENGEPISRAIADRVAAALDMDFDELLSRDDLEDMKLENDLNYYF